MSLFFSLGAICALATGTSATPLRALEERQVVDIPPPSSSSSSSGTGDAGGQPVPTAAVIAISVVLGTGVIVLLLIQIRQWRKRRQGRDGRPTDSSLQALTAEQLAGTTSRPSSRGGGTGTERNANGTNVGVGAGGQTRGRRSRRRGVRRTESGRSVKTLPEYSKEAGDEELVLVRRRSESESDLEEVDEEDEYQDSPDRTSSRGQPEMAHTGSVPITIRPASPTSRSQSASRSRSPPSLTIAQDSTPEPSTSQDADNSSSTIGDIQHRGWGEAPTYLEAMSALDPDAPPRPSSQVPAPRPGALQRTASGFKDLLTRPFAPGAFRSPSSGNASGTGVRGQSTPGSAGGGGYRSRAGSTSALLHPTTSRFSTTSTADYPSPWASTHSLLISPPVPNSAMRASFDGASIPRGGLTKEQMRFLSSNEAVNLVGIRLEDVPGSGSGGQRQRRRRSDMSAQESPRLGEEVGVEEAPPPTWEQIEGERRASEAYDRRNLANPVQRDDDEAGMEAEEDAVAGEEAEQQTVETEGVKVHGEEAGPEGEAVVVSQGPSTSQP